MRTLGRYLVELMVLCVVVVVCLVLLVKMPTYTRAIEDRTEDFINPQDLRQHVTVLSERYLPRSCDGGGHLAGAAQFIRSQFVRYSSKTSLQSYAIGAQSYSNVVAKFGPDTQNIIVVGAHYDAYSNFPGADDNASGVAGLIELARLLQSESLRTQIVLVAYACEEPPFYAGDGMGSVVHAKSLAGVSVRLMISLEMIGYFSQQPNSQDFPMPFLEYLYPRSGHFIAVVGSLFSLPASSLKTTINRVTDLDAFSINAPTFVPGIDFSDHRSYWALDYPAVMVTDTAFYRNKAYHTGGDTAQRLNYVLMAKVVYGVFQHVVMLANEGDG